MNISFKPINSEDELHALLEHMHNPNIHQEFDMEINNQFGKWENIHLSSNKCCKCNTGHFVIRNGKKGLFGGCSNFPSCKNSMNIENITYDILKRTGFNLYQIETRCWKCNTEISVLSYFPVLDNSILNKLLELQGIVLGSHDKIDAYLERKYSTLQNRYSNTAHRNYVSNVCPHCNMIQGMNMKIAELYAFLEQLPMQERNKLIIEKIPVWKILSFDEWSEFVKETIRYY